MGNFGERIEKFIRSWDQWSPAERKRMDQLVEEILDHCKNGTGNGFVRSWCDRILTIGKRFTVKNRGYQGNFADQTGIVLVDGIDEFYGDRRLLLEFDFGYSINREFLFTDLTPVE